MSRLISVAQASEMLGVTVKTLKIWTNEGKIKSYRTAGNHRRFKIEDIEKFLGDEAKPTVNTKKEKLEPNEEMVNDLLNIVTCFQHGYMEQGVAKMKKIIAELETERGENDESNSKSSVN